MTDFTLFILLLTMISRVSELSVTTVVRNRRCIRRVLSVFVRSAAGRLSRVQSTSSVEGCIGLRGVVRRATPL